MGTELGYIDVDEMRQRIQSVFPSQPFFGSITNGCACDECTALVKSLYGRKWDALDNETMDVQFGSLSLLTLEAFTIFVPAWLIRSLDNIDAEEQKFREWTLYSLALYSDEDGPDELSAEIEKLRQQSDQLNPEQLRVIADFLRLIHDRTPISKWNQESIRRSLELIWDR